MRKNIITSAIRKALDNFGYEVSRTRDQYAIQQSLLVGQPVRTIFDVGANIGDTVAAYRRTFPDAVLHAFEPVPACMDALAGRFASDGHVKLHQKGVGAVEETSKIFLSGGKSTHSMLGRPVDGKSYHREDSPIVGELDISVITVDGFVERQGIDHVDVLKIDVEGAEDKVLAGAVQLLKDQKASLLCMEVMFVTHYQGQELFHQLVARLDAFGYSVFDIPHFRRAKNGQLRWGDVIFVNEEIRKTQVDAS
jgi:FkbM family methyltransferase